MAQDRLDIRYSVTELCWEMSIPSRGSWRRLKKWCRFLKGTPRVMQKVDLDNVATVYVDSDWAGCARTGRRANEDALCCMELASRLGVRLNRLLLGLLERQSFTLP